MSSHSRPLSHSFNIKMTKEHHGILVARAASTLLLPELRKLIKEKAPRFLALPPRMSFKKVKVCAWHQLLYLTVNSSFKLAIWWIQLYICHLKSSSRSHSSWNYFFNHSLGCSKVNSDPQTTLIIDKIKKLSFFLLCRPNGHRDSFIPFK